MFKLNKKETRTTSTSELPSLSFSRVSIVDIEQAHIYWTVLIEDLSHNYGV